METPPELIDFNLEFHETEEIHRRLGPISREWDTYGVADHMVLHPRIFFSIGDAREVSFGGNSSAIYVLNRGFSGDELWGRWTVGDEACIAFNSDVIVVGAVNVIVFGVTPFAKIGQQFFFSASVNGSAEMQFSIEGTNFEKQNLSIKWIADSKDVQIVFRFPKTKAPEEAPTADPRPLGLAFWRMELFDES